ncbi:SDR family oxidoreductase [Tenacibaculum xiamenense]|uniref:SDR family oxidoreductase n=1 Tax=Tenacibaculum xiamenense TaxID=1261553 RepID=UPI00389493C0
MDLKNNTILITGGSSGIGLELSRELVKRNNEVIVCGRSIEKLQKAKEYIPELHIFQCDISSSEQCKELINKIVQLFPKLNVLINNAAIVHKTSFTETEGIVSMAEKEIAVNLTAPIQFSSLLADHFTGKDNATIINVTTGLIYMPRIDYPFYNATKAALHSFTMVLRLQLALKRIKVTEVMFPAVDTPWHNGNPPKIAIPVEKAVSEMLVGLEKGKCEIRIGGVKLLYFLSRLLPNYAFKLVNNLKDK